MKIYALSYCDNNMRQLLSIHTNEEDAVKQGINELKAWYDGVPSIKAENNNMITISVIQGVTCVHPPVLHPSDEDLELFPFADLDQNFYYVIEKHELKGAIEELEQWRALGTMLDKHMKKDTDDKWGFWIYDYEFNPRAFEIFADDKTDNLGKQLHICIDRMLKELANEKV